jgi:hypothetical protein
VVPAEEPQRRGRRDRPGRARKREAKGAGSDVEGQENGGGPELPDELGDMKI